MLSLANIDLNTLLARIIVLVTAFSVHEFAHAWTANYFGDDTPRLNGRLTLNPLAHLDILGSIMLLVAGFGWAKPVPVNPYALQRRSSAAFMWVSLAGPLSNLLLAVIAAILFRLMRFFILSLPPNVVTSGFVVQLLAEFIYINLLLMLFNLIPIAPLDGEKVAEYLLPPKWSQALSSVQPYGPYILVALLFIGPYIGLPFVDWIITGPLTAIFNLLIG